MKRQLLLLVIIVLAAMWLLEKKFVFETSVVAETLAKEVKNDPAISPAKIEPGTAKTKFKSAKQIYKEALNYTIAVVSEWDDAKDLTNPNYPKKTSFCSGFVKNISDKSYIYTVRHCFGDYPNLSNFKVWIEFSNAPYQEAEVVGYSEVPLDFALLKFKDEKFFLKTAATLGNSDALEVGDSVIAIGHPKGIKNYLSSGKIGRLNLTELQYYFGPGLIGTETHLGPGNSGGPLFNDKGEVVGLNEAVMGDAVFPAISLVIPINQAEAVLPKILKGGEIKTADLGYHIEDVWKLSATVIRELGLKNISAKGPVVLGPKTANPLYLPRLWPFSSLREGDIILSYNGKPVKSRQEIGIRNLEMDPGTKIKISIFRNGRRMEKEVKLEDLKSLFGSENLKTLKNIWKNSLIQKK